MQSLSLPLNALRVLAAPSLAFLSQAHPLADIYALLVWQLGAPEFQYSP